MGESIQELPSRGLPLQETHPLMSPGKRSAIVLRLSWPFHEKERICLRLPRLTTTVPRQRVPLFGE